MTTQIAVRLPDELVEMVDRMIDQGRGTSRADIVTQALRRVQRQEMGEHDAAIYARYGEDPEFEGMAKYAASVHLDLD